MNISIKTVILANAMCIAKNKLAKKNPWRTKYFYPENKEVNKIMADKDKLKSAFKKAWDSVVNNKF